MPNVRSLLSYLVLVSAFMSGGCGKNVPTEVRKHLQSSQASSAAPSADTASTLPDIAGLSALQNCAIRGHDSFDFLVDLLQRPAYHQALLIPT